MGKATNEAVTAKEKARQRMVTLYADRAARDARIEAAAARAITAAEKTAAALSDADTARAEARLTFEATLGKINTAEQTARSKAEPAVSAALTDLKTEKLTLEEIAALTDLPVGEVRRLLKPAPPAAPTTAPATEPAAVEPAQPATAAGLAGPSGE